MQKVLLSLAACALVCLCSASAQATASFVYHEQSASFAASPTCPSGETNTGCGRYVENTDRNGNFADGYQIYSPETYSLHFKVEYEFFTNQLRVYYTTDGSNPAGSYGVPSGTTQVAVGSYGCSFSSQLNACRTVNVPSASIPPQPAGTTVKYIIGAYFEDGTCPGGAGCGPEVFGNSGKGDNNSGFECASSTCATQHQYSVIAAPATPLIISEFRLSGPTGNNDEFIEIYNNSNAAVTVNTFDGSTGFALVPSNDTTNPRFVIPNGTVIPARGHFLGTNTTGYSLGTYEAGSTTTFATADTGGAYTTNINNNAGIALFNTADPANFTLDRRLDAVGPASLTNTLFKEGTGYPNLSTFTLNYSFYRRFVGGLPSDTGNNAADFYFVDPTGTNAGAGARLGAPGPENLSSPVQRNSTVTVSLLDATKSSSLSPNRERNTTPLASNGTNGSLSIRRRITNNTGADVTRLRFRIADITTFPRPDTLTSDVRALSSGPAIVVTNISDPATCSSTSVPTTAPPCSVTVRRTVLEQATVPQNQPNGGGFNSSLSANFITLASPLPDGGSVNVQFMLGVMEPGNLRFVIIVEALP
jgi:hypothetical protein